jgi:uncharacterized protein YidB (DUF937 family)
LHMVQRFSQSRRTLLVRAGGALVGCAALGAVSLGLVSAEQAPTEPALATEAFTAQVADTGFVQMDEAQIKQQHDKFISTLASKLGVSSDKLQQALDETQKELGLGPLGPGAKGFSISISDDLSTAAKVIGVSVTQLQQELSGKSLTDVAKAHNVDPQTVANAIKSARIAELDKATSSGKAPADFVTQVKANLDKEIEMQMTIVRGANGGPGEPDLHVFRMVDEPAIGSGR